MADEKMPIHMSDCALHNGPARIPGACDCGADPGMDPITYGSEYPGLKSEEAGAQKWHGLVGVRALRKRRALARAALQARPEEGAGQ